MVGDAVTQSSERVISGTKHIVVFDKNMFFSAFCSKWGCFSTRRASFNRSALKTQQSI